MLTRRQPNDDSPRPEAMKRATNTFAFVSSSTEDARAAAKRLASIYGQTEIAEADVVVALGGDGFLLQTLRETMSTGKKVYGMNRGTVGFLMNEYREEGLPGRISAAIPETIRPLEMETATEDGTICHALAINEVALWRQSYQTAKIRIAIDGKVRLEELSCDGVMVATPAGSTAYNLSAHGPILPLDAPLLALTPVSPFRPRRWRGALIPEKSTVRHSGRRQTSGERRRRPYRVQVGCFRDSEPIQSSDGDATFRRQSLVERTDSYRTVPILSRAGPSRGRRPSTSHCSTGTTGT